MHTGSNESLDLARLACLCRLIHGRARGHISGVKGPGCVGVGFVVQLPLYCRPYTVCVLFEPYGAAFIATDAHADKFSGLGVQGVRVRASFSNGFYWAIGRKKISNLAFLTRKENFN